jgi:hypothetical protein
MITPSSIRGKVGSLNGATEGGRNRQVVVALADDELAAARDTGRRQLRRRADPTHWDRDDYSAERRARSRRAGKNPVPGVPSPASVHWYELSLVQE